jgi:hypothetical protein
MNKLHFFIPNDLQSMTLKNGIFMSNHRPDLPFKTVFIHAKSQPRDDLQKLHSFMPNHSPEITLKNCIPSCQTTAQR